MKTSLFLLILMCLAICGCKNQRHDHTATCEKVVLNPGSNDLSRIDIMNIEEWIEIKADSGTYIGNVKKFEVFNSDYYILDNINQKCVLRYSSSGELINKIGKLGDGPGEYAQIYDFTIDRKNNTVLILASQSKILVYGADGTFKFSADLDNGLVCNIAANKNGIMATSSYAAFTPENKNYLLYEYNHQLELIGKWLPYTEPAQSPYPVIMSNQLISLGTFTYYFDNINLVIQEYDCDENEVKPLISFELKNQMPKEIYKDEMAFMSKQLEHNWIKDFVVAPTAMIISYIYGGEYCITMIDQNNNVQMSGKYHGMFPTNYAIDGEYIVSPIFPDSYLNYWEKQDDIIKPNFEVSEDTNLMLMKWSISNS